MDGAPVAKRQRRTAAPQQQQQLQQQQGGAAAAAAAAPPPPPHAASEARGALIEVSERLRARTSALASTSAWGALVTHCYAPLEYACEPHRQYLATWGQLHRPGGVEALLVGINPGPYGMAQTGVPFGDVELVRDWLRVSGHVGKPEREHPKRPIAGFATTRREVSGQRFWGWARAISGTPEAFFAHAFVWNWCPLVWMDAKGANITPDKLPAAGRAPLFAACDDALREVIEVTGARTVVGVGVWAEACARRCAPPGVRVLRILHPSPASPAANAGDWGETATAALAAAGVDVRAWRA